MAVTIYDRIKVCAVIGAIFLLATGIASAFVDTTALDHLIFHSPTFWLMFNGTVFLAAPLVLRVLPVRGEDGRQFSPIMIIVMSLGAVVLGVGLLVSVLVSAGSH
jgi:uncharacterized membrane protein